MALATGIVRTASPQQGWRLAAYPLGGLTIRCEFFVDLRAAQPAAHFRQEFGQTCASLERRIFGHAIAPITQKLIQVDTFLAGTVARPTLGGQHKGLLNNDLYLVDSHPAGQRCNEGDVERRLVGISGCEQARNRAIIYRFLYLPHNR